MLKADLSDAGIPYVDDAERYADFHALRHTTGSWLAANGVSPKVAQAIMRHSDINLTMGVYTHLLGGQEAEAVAKLPDLSLPSPEAQGAVVTGTDGGTTVALFTKTPDSSRNHLATNDTASTERKSKKEPAEDNAKPSKKGRLDTNSPLLSPDDTGGKTNGRYRARTCDPLIKSQLSEYGKARQKRDLQQEQSATIVPAYKQRKETTPSSNTPLPPELAEIAARWPRLPQHIKAAIMALAEI
jgi:Phage integrase family